MENLSFYDLCPPVEEIGSGILAKAPEKPANTVPHVYATFVTQVNATEGIGLLKSKEI
jgi:hypothetical protein